MRPSLFHVPPRPAASANVVTNPLLTSIRLSFPPAKKPMERLSGDQNGNTAFSVPTSGRVSVDSSERSRKPGGLDSATNTIFSPSGEIANDVTFPLVGVAISTRISGGGDEERRAQVLMTTRTSRAMDKANHAICSRRDRPRAILPTFVA